MINGATIWGMILNFGEGSPIWYLFYGVMVLLVLLVLSKQSALRKRYLKDPESNYDASSPPPAIPALTPLEAALFIGDCRLVMVQLIISSLLKGIIGIEELHPLKIALKEAGEETPLEREFKNSINPDGSLCRDPGQSFLELIARTLREKIWLSDKTMLRHYLQDRIELDYETIREKGRIETPQNLLWLLLHRDFESDGFRCPSLQEAPGFAPLVPLLAGRTLQQFIGELSREIYECETRTEEFSGKELLKIFDM